MSETPFRSTMWLKSGCQIEQIGNN